MRTSAIPCPRGPRAGRLLALISTAAVLAGLAACSEQPKAFDTPCGVVIDGSGSGDATKDGFNAEAKLKSELLPFLKEQECSTVDFAPITYTSQISSCKVGRIDLDPAHDATTDQEAQRRKARLRASEEAMKELRCARKERPGSDVWGALDRIGSAMPSGGPAAKLLVISDFDQSDPEFRLGRTDLTGEATRKKAIDSLVEGRGLPAIKGMTVYTVGFGMKYGDRPSAYRDFKAFWTDALEGRAKADVDNRYE
ncbi:hypothetical protein [Streptomyces sp. SHP 1-2]|uniref:hypothetical protein n=1 Tax=Streptomyces sp. SHP 1-2 TaxID=2769489 RepID=UPI002237DAA7|nr:hypothetical protein [Streptomyces sp. SHP 1-2]MCW5254304.1 hypothetical protein [Streptomyces sp. SHP 1-2]